MATPIKSRPKQADDKVAGYDMTELAKAPVEPPKLSQAEPEQETSNQKVRSLIAIGAILFLVGLLLMLINLWFGFAVMAVGGVMVVFAVFTPVK